MPAAATDATAASSDLSSQPTEVRLQLVSAPAAFGQPIGINKAISPALQVLLLALAHFTACICTICDALQACRTLSCRTLSCSLSLAWEQGLKSLHRPLAISHALGHAVDLHAISQLQRAGSISMTNEGTITLQGNTSRQPCADTCLACCLQAQVEMVSSVPTQLHVKLVAYLITSDQLLNLSQWDPNAHVVSEHIIGGVAEQTVPCDTVQAVLPDGSTVYKGSYNLSFRGQTALLCCAVLCCAVKCCAMSCCVVFCCGVLHRAVLRCALPFLCIHCAFASWHAIHICCKCLFATGCTVPGSSNLSIDACMHMPQV